MPVPWLRLKLGRLNRIVFTKAVVKGWCGLKVVCMWLLVSKGVLHLYESFIDDVVTETSIWSEKSSRIGRRNRVV